MLLIAYPHLNFYFHPGTGLAWLRDEDSSDTAVIFHCLTPAALAAVPGPEIERIHLNIAAAYNNYGADQAEKDLPAIPVSFIERPDATPPADLPEWFLAIEPEDNARGTWIIHTAYPVFAALVNPQDASLDRTITPRGNPTPIPYWQMEATAAAIRIRRQAMAHQPAH